MASRCYYDILTNNVLPLSYRRSNIVAGVGITYYGAIRDVLPWSTYISECHV